MIEVERITFGYSPSFNIFQDFYWVVETNERWAVIGPSGCGKSTLLSLIAGLTHPTDGQIRIDGNRIFRPRPLTGLIIQDYGLLPWATVRENVELGLKVRVYYGPDGIHAPISAAETIKHDVDHWMIKLGINLVAKRYPNKISGGQRQRTALARTLVMKPDLLLMDEPFSSLDAPTREGLQTLSIELCNEQGLTLVIVTHSIEEAVIMGEKILILNSPPNQKCTILENPGSNLENFRDTPGYISLCRQIRGILDEE
jgi:NitT/TauT family transport system ATP-binding protein